MSPPINQPISRLTLAIALTAGGAVGAGTAARSALDDDATTGVTSRPLVASEAVVTAVVDGDTLRAETLTADDLGRCGSSVLTHPRPHTRVNRRSATQPRPAGC